MRIHATAIIHPRAEIANSVEIGPYAVIGAQVRIGASTVVQSHVVLEGEVEIGEKNVLCHGVVLGGPPQDLSFKQETRSAVRIGAGNVLREYCTVHRGTAEGTATVMGDRNFLMAGTHVGHNCRIGTGVVIANNCLLGGNVQIDDGAFIGGGSTFHQGVRVGRLVMAQGMSGLGKDVPPFLMVAGKNSVSGLNVIGLRRAGFSAAERDEIKRAFVLLYKSRRNTAQALKAAEADDFSNVGREFFEFVAQAKQRGIVPYRNAREKED